MREQQLAASIITNSDGDVLLLRRTDHNQWQLPGGRVETDELGGLTETPLQAAVRETQESLNIAIDPRYARHLGAVVFSQGEVVYSCDWFHAPVFSGKPFLLRPEVYDTWNYVNLRRYGVGKLGLSPNVEMLKTRIQNDELQL